MIIRIAALTHRGSVREHNEDCAGWFGWALSGEVTQTLSLDMDIVEPTVVVVCDGMGGHGGGEVASRMAVSRLTMPGAAGTGDEQALTRLLQGTSDAINDAAVVVDPATGRPMGCTAVGVVLRPDGTAKVFNVGDSRCYRVEGRYLAQLSVDHRSPASGALTQALGGGRRMVLDPEYFECPVPAGQGLLLCTDGLTDYADFGAIEERVLSGGPNLLTGLRDLALAGGGGDNVTVIQISAVEDVKSHG